MAKTFERVTHTHARKEYTCKNCGKTIPVGAEVEGHFGKAEDGSMHNYKLCAACKKEK